MDILNDPVFLSNLAYLLLAAGLIFAALAAFSPGTGVLEIIALFFLLAAGYGVVILPTNWWALLFLLAGGVLFVLAVRKPKQWAYLAGSIAALIAGSVFLFHGERWWIPAVNPLLAFTVSLVSGVFFWFATRKYLEAASLRPTHDLQALVGARGEARSEIHAEGSAQVAGELWSAYSDESIPDGAPVRVVERQGFVLKVEAIAKE